VILFQIDSSSLLYSSGLTTLVILFTSLAIFGWLAVRYRNIRSFEFQISIFIMVYIIGEIIEDYNKTPFFSVFPYVGSQTHLVAGVFLSIILWIRLYSARESGRKIVDKIEPIEEGTVSGGDDDGSSNNRNK
jgi:cytochrome b561